MNVSGNVIGAVCVGGLIAKTYFADNFPQALPFLPRILQLPSP